MKKRDKKKQAKVHNATLKRALYEKARRQKYLTSKAKARSTSE